MAAWVLPAAKLHRPACVCVPPAGVPRTEAARHLQRSQAHHLQYADFLGGVDLFHPSLHQLTRKVLGSRRDICNISFQFRSFVVHLCTQMLHNSSPP